MHTTKSTGDGGMVGIWSGISGFGFTTAKIYMENMNGKLYCDVLQHQLKHSMAQIPKNTKLFSARPGSLTYVQYRERKNCQIKAGFA